jgi:hypothetical protein
MLREDFGLVGFAVADPANAQRTWTVQSVYAPLWGRKLAGLRVKLTDNKNFVTFCNQRDFEVLLGVGAPGDWCQWADQEYVGPGTEEWYGFCMDTPDLCDDLYERELELLAQYQLGHIDWAVAEITRRIHLHSSQDAEDLWIPDLGQAVEVIDIETLSNRWLRISRDNVEWKRLI